MPRTIAVVFDGRTFVPAEPVDQPAGTAARLVIDPAPADPSAAGAGAGQPFRTLDEYMADTRGRPWPYPLVPFEPPPPGFENYVPPE